MWVTPSKSQSFNTDECNTKNVKLNFFFFFYLQDGLHASHITLTYHHKGQRILIDLKRNDDLLPSEHFLRYQNSNTTQGHVVKNFTKTEIELCHYQASCEYFSVLFVFLSQEFSFYYYYFFFCNLIKLLLFQL